MYNLSNVDDIKKILSKHNFKFSKSLGQNFIIDSSICPKMAEYCSQSSECGILEIGPGIGVLTVELAKRFKKVVSVEIDKRLISVLSETTRELKNIKIINNDILKLDLKKLIANEFENYSEINVCANLPYYITSDIIMYILENNAGFKSLTVMLQKEAAERICAKPGTRQNGAISIATRYYGIPEILFDVKRNSFLPSPNVDSCVIKITISDIQSKKISNKTNFFKIVKASYSQRRKNILNSLSSSLNKSKNEIQSILTNLNIDYTKRAEQLSFDEFIAMSNII